MEKIPMKIQKGIIWVVILAFTVVYAVRLLDSRNCVVTVELQKGAVMRLWKYLIQ